MKLKLSRLHVVAALAALAVIAFLLRTAQLSAAFDDAGIATGEGVVFFSVVSVLVVILFAAYSFTLKGRKKYNAIAGRGLTEMALGGAAALFMVISGATLLGNQEMSGDQIIAIGSILTGLCWGATAAARFLGKKVHGALFLLPAAFYVVELVCRFRFWTRDPLIIDYCYDLFALICIMFAVFHLGGFYFEQGARRMTVFFSMSGIFFAAAAMVEASSATVFGYAAAILWLFANLWLLLRPNRKREILDETEEPANEAEPDVPTEEPAEQEAPAEPEEEGESL